MDSGQVSRRCRPSAPPLFFLAVVSGLISRREKSGVTISASDFGNAKAGLCGAPRKWCHYFKTGGEINGALSFFAPAVRFVLTPPFRALPAKLGQMLA